LKSQTDLRVSSNQIADRCAGWRPLTWWALKWPKASTS